MSWLVSYADLISGALGILASLVLGYPAFRAIRSKRYYATSQQLVDDAVAAGNERNKAHAKKIARRVEGMQLSGATEAVVCNSIGSILLLLSFVFLLVAAVDRRSSVSDPAPEGETMNTGESASPSAAQIGLR